MMHMHLFALTVLGLLLSAAFSRPHAHQHQRGIGNASMPIPFNSSTTEFVPLASLASKHCLTGPIPGHTGLSRSTITTTVTVTADIEPSSIASAVSVAPYHNDSILSISTLQEASGTALSSPSNMISPGTSSQTLSPSISASSVPVLTASASPSCSTTAFNKTDLPNLIGFNVVNQKPVNPNTTVTAYKSPEDWDTAFSLLRDNFAQINAVRMYSTTDGNVTHLMNALPAAENHDLKVLVGIWSGGPQHKDRFEQEKQALIDAIKVHGCDHIAAISVGNEDLYSVNLQGLKQDELNRTKAEVAKTLIDQVQQVRTTVRGLGCCIPVTHTDTSNEWATTDQPWVSDLIRACDQAIIANIFPYWTNVTITEAFDSLKAQSYIAMDSAQNSNKDVWLGETGWPISQPIEYNKYGTDAQKAQQYFHQIGCQILTSNGTGFYYVDWDQDAPKQGRPSFGLFDYDGEPLLQDMSCVGFKSDMSLAAWDNHLPDFLGRSQYSDQHPGQE